MSVFRAGLLDGRVAIVTGGGTGIGKAIATELHSLGCHVVIASRTASKLEAAAVAIQALHPDSSGRVCSTVCNIRRPDEITRMFEYTLSTFGKVDFLVNNAGGQFATPAESIPVKGWSAVVDTNLNGTFTCCLRAFELWMRDHGGSIVNIIAESSRGFPGMAHTGAARAAVLNLTRTLSLEWAEHGIRVNAVTPGVIYSETAISNYPDPTILTDCAHHIPAKRLGTPEEVSAVTVFLLTPAAAYVSGAEMVVDGAWRNSNLNWHVPVHRKMPAYGSLPEAAKAQDGVTPAQWSVKLKALAKARL